MSLNPEKPRPSRWIVVAKRAGIVLGGSLVMLLLGTVLVSWFVTARYGANEGTSPGSDSGRDAPVSLPPAVYEKPEPTAEQIAAIAGGTSFVWARQGLAWTLPQRWRRAGEDATSCGFQLDDESGGAMLTGSVSPVTHGAAAESSLDAFYAQSVPKRKSGAYAELRYLELDGVKGVMWREAPPSKGGSPQQLQWTGYRTHRGEQQLISIVLACRAEDFGRYEPALYGILYSTRIPH